MDSNILMCRWEDVSWILASWALYPPLPIEPRWRGSQGPVRAGSVSLTRNGTSKRRSSPQGRREAAQATRSLGSSVSPLLANLYLDTFYEELIHQGFRLVRFADDFVVAMDPETASAAKVEVEEALARLRLDLNPDVTAISSIDDGLRLPLRSVAGARAGQGRRRRGGASSTRRGRGAGRLVTGVGPPPTVFGPLLAGRGMGTARSATIMGRSLECRDKGQRRRRKGGTLN